MFDGDVALASTIRPELLNPPKDDRSLALIAGPIDQ